MHIEINHKDKENIIFFKKIKKIKENNKSRKIYTNFYNTS